MISSFESLSVELWFEIFEYLPPYDLFQSFINIEPKQIISLVLSDETVPNQVGLFQKYFPNFQHQFLHLQAVKLIVKWDYNIALPKSVPYLEIRRYDPYDRFDFDFSELLEQQANILTHLKIDRIGLLNYLDISFPNLTHLTIDGGFHSYLDEFLTFPDQYKNVDASAIFHRIGSSLTHLDLYIGIENETMNIDLQPFSHCLTHLTLHFCEDIILSFQSFQQYLKNLSQLTHLTLRAHGQSDLIDSYRWQNYLSKTNILKFNFHFRVDDHTSSILESFRTSFWTKEKHWYVGYFIGNTSQQTSVFTIPRFHLKSPTYPSSMFPYQTTAPINIEQAIFYKNYTNELTIDIDEYLVSPIHRFTHIKSLFLKGTKLLSLDILQTIVDFHSIEELDVTEVKYLLRQELDQLINQLPRVKSLTMEYNPLFVVPSKIHTLRLEDKRRAITIDNLCYTIPYVKILEIPLQTKEMMLDIIDQLDHIDNFLFLCDGFLECDYLEFFIEKFRLWWLEEDCYRLRMHHFTYLQEVQNQEIRMSIGGPKMKKYSEVGYMC